MNSLAIMSLPALISIVVGSSLSSYFATWLATLAMRNNLAGLAVGTNTFIQQKNANWFRASFFGLAISLGTAVRMFLESGGGISNSLAAIAGGLLVVYEFWRRDRSEIWGART